jgi:hypothetical protein
MHFLPTGMISHFLDTEKGQKMNIVMHVIAGSPYLSGSAACHWYFNPDIPEAQDYYERLVLYIKFR